MNQNQYNNDLASSFMGDVIKVARDQNVWIEYQGPKAQKLAAACADYVDGVGAMAFLIDSGSAALDKTILPMTPAQLRQYGAEQLEIMKGIDSYIRIRDDADMAKTRLTADQMQDYKRELVPMMNHRVSHTRWLVVSAPTEEMAAACNMPYPEFLSFYRDVCLTNYGKMAKAVEPLKRLMTGGNKVRIYSPAQETDLIFSIEGIPAVACVGERNIPDGECYTAPVKDSVNGTIKFGPSKYNGQSFQFIKLKVEEGRIIEAAAETAERTQRLNKILNADDGARYFGEFSINFNPYIKHPIGDILFDEKIDGGVHFAAGKSYDLASNGNNSAVHWDMVHIQRPDYGGGQIWIDDRLIRQNGRFIVPELLCLNPENLMAATLSARTAALTAAIPNKPIPATISPETKPA